GAMPAEPTFLDGLNDALKAVHTGERQKGWDGVPPAADHVDLYGEAFLDASYAVGSRGSARSRSGAELRQTIAEILASLGSEGREYLRQGVHMPHSHREALTALASYNDIATLPEIVDLATDAEYAYRDAAVTAFASLAALWPEEAEPYWQELLRYEPIGAGWRYVRHVCLNRPTRAATLVAPLLESSDTAVRDRAQHAYERFGARIRPDPREGLEIRIATDRQTYGYLARATLAVELANRGDLPIPMTKFVFDSADLFDDPKRVSDDFNLELVMPNGDRRTYPERDWVASQAATTNSGRTLDPGGSTAAQIDIRKHCVLAQPGAYRAQLSYRRLLDTLPMVRSNWVDFAVKPPSSAHVDRLVARLDIDGPKTAGFLPAMRVCYILGELGDPRAIDALRAVALLPVKPNRERNSHAMLHRAREALTKFASPALVPMWIALLNGEWDLPAEQLAKLGDRRALAPLRGHAVNSGHVAAAQALAELGDGSVVRFMRWDAQRSMDPEDESTWSGSQALGLLLPGERLADRLRHEHPAVRRHALWTASREGLIDVLAKATEHADVGVRREAVGLLADWHSTVGTAPGDEAIRIRALQRALSAAEPDIRHDAAFGLAHVGDDSCEPVLREDLHAADYGTRARARTDLLRLRAAL
ncbi:hypothetical protein HOI71_06635, partial [Candidatus Poribacteria bacterium]|nr:hypothetical protein [Candidatus Poribacteria bacterium]